MAMVSNKFLAALSVELGFHRFLLKNSPAIELQVREFVGEIGELKRESQGAPDYWTATKNPPKVEREGPRRVKVVMTDRSI